MPQPTKLDGTNVRGLHDARELALPDIVDLQR
jgi:hypothetical protein